MSLLAEWEWGTPIGIAFFLLFKFSEEDNLQVPLYDAVLDRSWNPPDLDSLVDYLRQGRSIASVTVFQPIVCPLCGEILDPITSWQQSDGRWIWLNTLGHYVRYHHVRLPDRMVEAIRANGYLVPC